MAGTNMAPHRHAVLPANARLRSDMRIKPSEAWMQRGRRQRHPVENLDKCSSHLRLRKRNRNVGQPRHIARREAMSKTVLRAGRGPWSDGIRQHRLPALRGPMTGVAPG